MKYRIAWAQGGGERVGGRLGVGDVLVQAIFGCQLPHPDQQLDAALASVSSDLAVVRGRLRTELLHLAEDREPPSTALSEARWSSAARIEIGLAL